MVNGITLSSLKDNGIFLCTASAPLSHPMFWDLRTGGGEVRNRERETDSRGGPEAGEGEAPAWKLNDLLSSTNKFKTNENAVLASSRTGGWERVDGDLYKTALARSLPGAWERVDGDLYQTMQEGAADLLRCNYGSRLTPTQQLPIEGIRMLTARPNQVDGHLCRKAGAGARRNHGRIGCRDR